MAIFKSQSAWQTLLLLLILSVMTVVLIGDFQVRLANTHGDDGPVLYSYFLQNPEKFEGDNLITYGYASALGTLQNWLPALLLKTINLSPKIPTWIFLFLQNVLLGFAVWHYTRVVTRQTEIAWIAVFFACVAQPWAWNLVNYASVLYIPLAGYLALPFILFAASALLQGYRRKVIGWLILSGMIHPSLTLYMIVIVGVYWLMQEKIGAWQQSIIRLLPLGIVVAICAIPGLLLQGSVESVTTTELMEGFSHNQHIIPWNYPGWWNKFWIFSSFMVLMVLALRHVKDTNSQFFTFWLATLGGTIILALMHITGFLLEIPKFLQLYPLRATVLLVMFSLPLVIVYLTNKIRSTEFIERWVAISLLLCMAYYYRHIYPEGVFWMLILILFTRDIATGQVSKLHFQIHSGIAYTLHMISWFVMLVWIGLLLIPNWAAWSIFGGKIVASDILKVTTLQAPVGSAMHFVTMIAAGAIIATIYYFGINAKRLPQTIQLILSRQTLKTSFIPFNGIGIILVVLIGFTMYHAWETGAKTRTPYQKSLYEAQLWAKYHTPDNAAFMVYALPWRTISQRKAIHLRAYPWYLYSANKQAKEYEDQLLRFYGLDKIKMSAVEYYKFQKIAYDKLNEIDVLRLARYIGGDYIVRKINEKPLRFLKAYQNEQFVIYKLPI